MSSRASEVTHASALIGHDGFPSLLKLPDSVIQAISPLDERSWRAPCGVLGAVVACYRIVSGEPTHLLNRATNKQRVLVSVGQQTNPPFSGPQQQIPPPIGTVKRWSTWVLPVGCSAAV